MTGHRVYLHLGCPKTGTTFLQAMLHRHADRLLQEGVLYPPPRQGHAHHAAGQDLRKVRRDGRPPRGVQGSWDRLVRAVRAWPGPGAVVVSSELLAFARPEQAAQGLRSLEGHEVHLVLTVRDLVRQVPAVWQENVKNRSTLTYDDFLRQLQELEVPWRRLQWAGQDPAVVLERWGRSVPPHRVHIVTVPPHGSAPGLLWQRFAQVIGVDATRYPVVGAGANTSLGPAQAEVVRRLNEQVRDAPAHFYGRHIKHGIAQGVLVDRRGRDRLVLPESMLPWVQRRTEQIIESVSGRGYDIVGDLDDLRPPVDGSGVGVVPEPDPREVADAALAAAGYLARALTRTRVRTGQGRAPGVGEGDGRGVRRLSATAPTSRGAEMLRRGYRRLRKGHR